MAPSTCCKNTTFFTLSVPKPPISHRRNYSPGSHNVKLCNFRSNNFFICSNRPLLQTYVSSNEAVVVEEREELQEGGNSETLADDDGDASEYSSSSFKGCKACGRDEIERGCNGEGRIQGGIATVPGFGWWPIKAYRPCPAYVASGGRYKRTGQSMDEVVSGSGGKKTPDGTSNKGDKSSEKKGRT